MRTKLRSNKRNFGLKKYLTEPYYFKKFKYCLRPKMSGRNYQGNITVRHRGGGIKRKIMGVDFQRKLIDQEYMVVSIRYDATFSSKIATIISNKNGLMFNILCPDGLGVGNTVKSVDEISTSFYTRRQSKLGWSAPLSGIQTGSVVHSIESFKNSSSKFVRSAGTSAKLIKKVNVKNREFVCLKMPSGEEKYFSGDCFATLGRVSVVDRNKVSRRKAGTSRLMGVRPKVRGVAMNPIDHPHGGGEGKSSGGRTSVSKWGKLTKGFKTTTFKTSKKKKKLLSRIKKRKNVVKNRFFSVFF